MRASYDDNTSFVALEKRAPQCVNVAARIASIVVDELSRHSLLVNCDLGKSEYVVDLVGPDTLRTKRAMFEQRTSTPSDHDSCLWFCESQCVLNIFTYGVQVYCEQI